MGWDNHNRQLPRPAQLPTRSRSGPSVLPLITLNIKHSLLHVSELDVRADPEVEGLLLAVADQLLLPHLTDRLA